MNNNQIIIIIIFSMSLALIRFYLLDDPEFTLIKKERIVKEISDFNVPEVMTEPMAINLDFAKYLFDNDLAVFIDARDVEDFDAGHIQGAINIPYDYYEDYEEKINNLEVNKTYIIYCNGEDCSLSMDLADYFFNELLFEKVLIFEAGWPVWRDLKLPS